MAASTVLWISFIVAERLPAAPPEIAAPATKESTWAFETAGTQSTPDPVSTSEPDYSASIVLPMSLYSITTLPAKLKRLKEAAKPRSAPVMLDSSLAEIARARPP